jgi:mono/diheme cytochrome c family protein
MGGSLGCWEQTSADWFPQMKRQRAIQAFEGNATSGAAQRFEPPEGSVPAGTSHPDVGGMPLAAQEALPNPMPASIESLERGDVLFRRYCATCHGPEGHGDGPVAGPPFGSGPLGVVIPIGGRFSLADAFGDGHIYTTITLGRGRMPSYARIPHRGRWDLVNYIRALNAEEGRPLSPAAGATETTHPPDLPSPLRVTKVR